MTSKELADALLRQGVVADCDPASPQREVERAVRRSERWMRILAGTVMILWIAAAGTLVAAYYGFFIFIVPRMNELLTHPEQGDSAQGWQTVFQMLAWVSVPVVVSSGIACVLAATGTVLLVLHARRATLRHVAANLAAVSREIRLLQQTMEKRPQE